MRIYFAEEKRKLLRAERILGVLAAIDEDIFLPRVAVHVHIHRYRVSLGKLENHHLRIENFWVEVLARVEPATVQISS